MPTIDIDRDAAHEAAQRELGKPIYPEPSLTERLFGWIEETLYRLAVEGSGFPGGWLTIAVLLVITIAAIAVAVRVASRTMRTNRGGGAMFDAHELSAAEHRATAEQFAAAGDWPSAIRHRLRAVARHLEETSVVNPIPGRTATELARDAGTQLPDLAGELGSAARAFNDVTYGDRPGSESEYRIVADLDDHLRMRRASTGTTTSAATPAEGWAHVR